MIVFFITLFLIHESIALLGDYNTPTCGMTELPQNMNPAQLGLHGSSARIVFGYLANHTDMPWVVQIVNRGFARPYLRPIYSACTGSILNNWWVITAAHCFHYLDGDEVQWFNPGNIQILAGGRLAMNNPGQEVLQFPFRPPVQNYFIHPDYQTDPPTVILTEIVNDIALIRLGEEQPVVYNTLTRRFLVNHICLPTAPPNLNGIHRMAGYGRLGLEQNYFRQLMTFDARIYNYPGCQKTYNEMLFNFSRISRQDNNIVMPPGFLQPGTVAAPNDNRVVCTAAINLSATCMGDSGGPLTYQRPDGRWELVGILKAGNSAGRDFFNDIFIAIYDQLDDHLANLLMINYSQWYPCGHVSAFNVIHEYRTWIELQLEYQSPVFVGAPAVAFGALVVWNVIVALVPNNQNQQPQLEQPNHGQDVEQGQAGPGQLAEEEVLGGQMPPLEHAPGYYCGPGLIHFDPEAQQPGTVLPWPGYVRVPEGEKMPPVV